MNTLSTSSKGRVGAAFIKSLERITISTAHAFVSFFWDFFTQTFVQQNASCFPACEVLDNWHLMHRVYFVVVVIRFALSHAYRVILDIKSFDGDSTPTSQFLKTVSRVIIITPQVVSPLFAALGNRSHLS